MQFVKAEDLKIGMRLARPIYSKQGVLLFERDSKLTHQAINSVHNFGLIGVYILEPAEPVPPMSEEDLEFERFQTIMVFSIETELEKILQNSGSNKMQNIANMLIKKYGHLDKKVNFYQNLRSRNDFVYKHSLNVAILCTMISHIMNISLTEQMNTILAALVHDIGKVDLYKTTKENQEIPADRLWSAQLLVGDLIEDTFLEGIAIRRICYQAAKVQMDADYGRESVAKLVTGAKILLVANRYDEITAMQIDNKNSDSEVRALKELLDKPEIYDPEVVKALTKAIHILAPGVSVIMNSGEKALILRENERDILRPMLLSFNDNSIVDLSLPEYRTFEIVDIMKSLDNRCIMDYEALKQAGF